MMEEVHVEPQTGDTKENNSVDDMEEVPVEPQNKDIKENKPLDKNITEEPLNTKFTEITLSEHIDQPNDNDSTTDNIYENEHKGAKFNEEMNLGNENCPVVRI